jgi:predicted O-methyltransferase YrrM
MSLPFSTKQIIAIVTAAIIIGASGLVASAFLGEAGMAVPIALATVVLLLFVLESRDHQHRLFLRTLQEQRSTYTQLEALLHVIRATDPVAPLPPMRSWAASPDLLRELVSRILAERPREVVEASSGVSTIVIAYCLKRLGGGMVRSLEHEPVYAARTRQLIAEHGLEAFADVIDAPLVSSRTGNAELRWYDLSKAALPSSIDLLVVDGPPDTSGPQARYPALPLLKDRLVPGALVVLDDGARADERAIARRWTELVPGAELRYIELEAGAWMLRMPGPRV